MAANRAEAEREARRGGEVSRGQTKEGFKSQTKETELYPAAQEHLGRDLSRGGTGWDLRLT